MRTHYLGGREHAAIKHYFLRSYLKVLAYKTLQFQSEANRKFIYIDGFTGPWGARDDETYTDTSFGVAIDVLRSVKSRLGSAEIYCVFCETRRSAFRALERHVNQHAVGLHSKCIPGRFEDHIEEIQRFAGRDGFLFAFIDPQGWNVNAASITQLLINRWSEVLFNFMAEFIGRFPDYDKVRQSYAALLGDIDWRTRFEATPESLSNDDRILILFRDVLKEQWKFTHVLELPIRKLHRGRVFYKLVYGTRSPHGVLAFREAQAVAEREGFAVAIESEISSQTDLFSPDEHAQHIAASIGVSSPTAVAQITPAIETILRDSLQMPFLMLAAQVLETIPARERDIRNALGRMKDMGLISYSRPNQRSGMPTRKSVVFKA